MDSNSNTLVCPVVVLASQSPRRRDLLALVGIAHEVIPADIDESPHHGETHLEHVERLAAEKAQAIAAVRPDAVVIGADTIVVLDGALLDKPSSEEDALRTLTLLSGRSHTVHTAVAVSYRGETLSAVETVGVTFRELTNERIASYIRTGEPMDKAGAYGIQGYGATIVRRVDGDYFAVMGLPPGLLVELLAKHGLSYNFGPISLNQKATLAE